MPSLLRLRPSAVNESLDMKNIDLALDKRASHGTIADLSEGGNASGFRPSRQRKSEHMTSASSGITTMMVAPRRIPEHDTMEEGGSQHGD
uniref:Uncharacterized protein n=1 Tax=Oryza nivara TaxID=4536 RepID=A0A0E0G0G9_ORYNI